MTNSSLHTSNLRLAIMQPYLFPYIGYFQLVHSVDRFVVYDDVNYIKKGWINRNRILVNGAPHTFTLPLQGAGSFTLISDIGLGKEFVAWRVKFLKTLAQVYGKAPHFEQAMNVIERALNPERSNLSELLVDSLRTVMEHIGITTELNPTSRGYGNKELSGQERVVDICRKENAASYVNPIGGKELYAKPAFAEHGVDLHFLRGRMDPYPQFGAQFQPGLSVLDAMMFVQPSDLLRMMDSYTLE